MADEKTTYEGLLKDSVFLSSAYHSLRGMGDNSVSKDPKDILDTFLTQRRYFNVNLGSTIRQGSDIKELPQKYKDFYSHALSKTEAIPNLGKGSAPGWDATIDYTLAAISDPTNLLSILAGAFTGGTGGVMLQAGKEALKQGIMATLKSQIGKQALKQYGKGFLAEGAIAGAGGATQQVKSQEVDMALGTRKEGDYDYGRIALQGVGEGVASPLAGSALNLIGKGVKIGGGAGLRGLKNLVQKSVELATKDGSKIRSKVSDQSIQDVTNWFVNNLSPLSSVDEVSMRLMEKSSGEVRPIQEAVENISLKMDDRIKAKFNSDDGNRLINAAMEGDKKALAEVKKIDPEMEIVLKDWESLRDQAAEIARSSSYLGKKVKGIYKPKKNTPYVRDIYEKFEGIDRPSVEKFLARKENKKINDELFEAIVKNKKDYPKLYNKFFTKNGKAKWKTDSVKQRLLSESVRDLYGSVNDRSIRAGALVKKKDIPDVIKKIYGLNFNPAVRALETVKGVIDSSNRIRLGSSLADSLLSRKMAIRADNNIEASKLFAKQTGLPEQEMVPFATKITDNRIDNEYSPFIFKGDLVDPEIERIYVTKNQASMLKTLSEGFDGRIPKEFEIKNALNNDVWDTFSGIQGYLKKGKTVYNPNAHARNALGAIQYTISSGNYKGLYDGIKLLFNPTRRKEISEAVGKLGLKGSQVDINQIMTRIGDLDKVNNKGRVKFFTNLLTLGVPSLEKLAVPLGKGKKLRVGRAVSKAAQKVYVATDDLGKIATYLRERKRADSIWNARSLQEQNVLRKKFASEFNMDIKAKDFDTKLLDEAAVQKTMNLLPVYSRIPKILEKMRKVPVLGSFTAFPAENLRNKYHLFKIAGEEIQEGVRTGNNKLIQAGANRLVSQAAIASAPSLAAHTYNAIEGTSNVESALRKTLPSWSKNHALSIRKGDNKEDKDDYYYTDLSYNNPEQFAIDFVMPFMIAAANGEDLKENLGKTMVGIATKQAGAFLDPSMAIEAGKNMWGATEAMVAGDDDATAKFLTSYYKVAEPGLLQMMREAGTDLDIISDDIQRNMNPLYFGEERHRFSDTGDVSDFLARLGPNLNYNTYNPDTGLPVILAPWSFASKERKFKPKQVLSFATRTVLSNSKRDFQQGTRDISNMLIDSKLPINYKDIAKQYDEMLSEEFAAMKQIADIYSSFRQFMTPQKLNTLFLEDKDVRGTLSKEDIRFLISNKYKISGGKRLSQDNELFREIRKNNPGVNQRDLHKFFRNIESRYESKSLSEDVPEEIEFED